MNLHPPLAPLSDYRDSFAKYIALPRSYTRTHPRIVVVYNNTDHI